MPSVNRGNDAPKHLRPYLCHGVELSYRAHSDQAEGECFVCGKSKLYVSINDGLAQCKSCDAKGNIYTFLLKHLHAQSLQNTPEKDYQTLAEERKLLHSDTLYQWGVCKSSLTGEWLIPSYNANGRLNNLYRWVLREDRKRRELRSTAELHPGLMGIHLFDDKKSQVMLAEGAWDGMALWEVLGGLKAGNQGGYARTSKEADSYLADINVLAVPSCNGFDAKWGELLANKDVTFFFDSDHPRRLCQKCKNSYSVVDAPESCPACKVKWTKKQTVVTPVGYQGTQRACQILAEYPEVPKTVHYLRWGTEEEPSYNAERPSGYDVRDALTEGEEATTKIMARGENLSRIMDRVVPIPAEWVAQGAGVKEGTLTLPTKPCTTWKVLRTAFVKAMQWTLGYEAGLACMLAAITSVRFGESQLWLLLQSPPGCLDGDTPIYDPVDLTTVPVKERWKKGDSFFVYSLMQDGTVGICQALPPQQFPATAMYEVEFESSRRITVSAGHRFWDGDRYVSLCGVSEHLQQYGVYRLPSISGSDLSVHEQDAQHWKRTTEGWTGCYPACSYSCDGQLRLGEVYDQDDLPSQADAPQRRPGKHSGFSVHEPECNRLWTPAYRSSMLGCSGREEPHKPVSPPHGRASDDEPFGALCGISSHTESHLLQQGSSQLVDLLPPQTSSDCSQHQLLPVHHRRSQDGLQSTDRSLCECSPARRDQCTVEPSLAASLDEQLAESEHLLLEGTSGQLVCQHAALLRLQPRCDRSRTEQQPDFSSLVTKFPYVASVNKGRNLPGNVTLTESDCIVKITYVGERNYYDFCVPETNNYWACGTFHHNSGKTVLCNALATCRKWVYCVDKIKGVHSGYKADKSGKQDFGLIPKIRDKTLIMKDGDTFLNIPNLENVMADLRTLYDTNTSSHYLQGAGREYLNTRSTVIIAGTDSLHRLDDSELGQRFLIVSLMEGIDADMEEDICMKAMYRLDTIKGFESNGKPEDQDTREMTEAKQLCGGYVEHLRKHAQQLLDELEPIDDATTKQIFYMGKFVAHMRARPSRKQTESQRREMATRLCLQLRKLAYCLAVVFNKKKIDSQVMSIVHKVTMDSSRGRSLAICRALRKYPEEGLEVRSISSITGQSKEKERDHCRFLKVIGAVELVESTSRIARDQYRMHPSFLPIYDAVMKMKARVQ